MKIYAVIPARGGSKGIARKNIKELCGKPLIQYTIDVALQSERIAGVYVSSDDEEILTLSARLGARTIRRPVELAQDHSPTEAALVHAIDVIEQQHGAFDAVLTLQPTSPLRKAASLDDFVKEYEQIVPEYDALFSVVASKEDLWVRSAEKAWQRVFENAARRRQDREPYFIEEGSYYLTSTRSLRRGLSVLGERCRGYEVDPAEAHDINTPRDWQLAEFLIDHSR